MGFAWSRKNARKNESTHTTKKEFFSLIGATIGDVIDLELVVIVEIVRVLRKVQNDIRLTNEMTTRR